MIVPSCWREKVLQVNIRSCTRTRVCVKTRFYFLSVFFSSPFFPFFSCSLGLLYVGFSSFSLYFLFLYFLLLDFVWFFFCYLWYLYFFFLFCFTSIYLCDVFIFCTFVLYCARRRARTHLRIYVCTRKCTFQRVRIRCIRYFPMYVRTGMYPGINGLTYIRRNEKNE